MQIIIWFVNSAIVNGVATAIVGVVYGPLFPGTLALANDVLPPQVHMINMALL